MLKTRLGNEQGFSLVELMIVVAIIGCLATIAVPNYHHFLIRSYHARIASELSSMKTLIEGGAASDEGVYPATGMTAWYCDKTNYWGPEKVDYIPGNSDLPRMMSQLPEFSYMYISNGTDYKLLAHQAQNVAPTQSTQELFSGDLADRARDGGPPTTGELGSCDGAGDGSNIWAMSVYSPGAGCW